MFLQFRVVFSLNQIPARAFFLLGPGERHSSMV